MLLAIDIGNTNVVLGVFDGDRLIRSWRLSTRKDRTVDEYGALCRDLFRLGDLDPRQIEYVAVCSVVPPLNDCFQRMARLYFGRKAWFVDPVEQSMMPVRYNPPTDVGADRIVNAVAAKERHGVPAIVADFGTATTFDAVSGQGEYLGGIIAPGIGISAEALFSRASRLPRIEIRKPPGVIGDSTVHSIQSGIYYGYAGLVDGILKRMKSELGGAVRVVATGGLATLMQTESDQIDTVEDDLTVHGLRIFHHSRSL